MVYLLTYSMEQSPSWKANWFLQLVKKFPAFLEPKGLVWINRMHNKWMNEKRVVGGYKFTFQQLSFTKLLS